MTNKEADAAEEPEAAPEAEKSKKNGGGKRSN